MVGFNCNAFDNQIIEEVFSIYKNAVNKEYTIEDIIKILYNKAQELIRLPEDEKYKVLIPEWKFTIPHIDLYKQKHYDRPQKATSLKWLQFTMRCSNVQEMPIHHDSFIKKEDIPSILEYNWNDVESTADFFKCIMFETDLRLTLSDKYNLKLINASEPKMVREIFGKLLSEAMGITYADLKTRKTFRDLIPVKDIIFPYVKFETELCNDVLKWFSSLNVNPNSTEKEDKVERIFKFAQCETVLGLGGIHGCINSGRYKALESSHPPSPVGDNKNYDVKKQWIIKDLDINNMVS